MPSVGIEPTFRVPQTLVLSIERRGRRIDFNIIQTKLKLTCPTCKLNAEQLILIICIAVAIPSQARTPGPRRGVLIH